MSEQIEVLITLPFSEELVQQLQEVSPRLHIRVIKARKAEEIEPEVWKNVEILYTNRVLPAVEQAPRLQWIQFHWAGIDHAVNAPILAKPGLIATTLSGAAAPQMAEYIVGMMLALGRRLPELLNLQRLAEWPHDRWERFSPRELRDSTVGIVGYGSIGRQVARLLQPFGAKVLAAKRDVMHPEDLDYAPEGMGDPQGDLILRLYPIQALRAMLKECDFVAITVPLTPETRGLIGAAELAALKPTAFLVDTSRGGVVDHAALLPALRDRKMAGAALDVFPEEPLPADSPLWRLSNVILTPHISGNTPYYDERATALFAENLQRYVSGLPLFNRFDPQRGY
jgi:phosphoglycerate dehydrogenase-like enzyme